MYVNVPVPLPVVSVATLLNDPAPGAFAHNSTLASPEAPVPGSDAFHDTAIDADDENVGELAFEIGGVVSFAIVNVALATGCVTFPALSVARADSTYAPSLKFEPGNAYDQLVVPVAANHVCVADANALPSQYLPVDCCWSETSTVATPLRSSAALPHVSPAGVEQPAFHAAVVYDVAVGNAIDALGFVLSMLTVNVLLDSTFAVFALSVE